MPLMNTFVRWAIIGALLGGTALCQSLGDAARKNRETPHRKAVLVFDNDSLRKELHESVEEPQATVSADAKSDDTKSDELKGSPEAGNDEQSSAEPSGKPKAQDKDAASEDAEAAKTRDAEAAKTKQYEAAKAQIAAQKREIELLQRELDVTKKEEQVQTSTYYLDAGSRLRNPQAWTEQAQKQQDLIDAKSKALEGAKDKLESMREDARKAGVPASYTE